MRKTILIIFAFVITFSVFGRNQFSASAPTLAAAGADLLYREDLANFILSASRGGAGFSSEPLAPQEAPPMVAPPAVPASEVLAASTRDHADLGSPRRMPGELHPSLPVERRPVDLTAAVDRRDDPATLPVAGGLQHTAEMAPAIAIPRELPVSDAAHSELGINDWDGLFAAIARLRDSRTPAAADRPDPMSESSVLSDVAPQTAPVSHKADLLVASVKDSTAALSPKVGSAHFDIEVNGWADIMSLAAARRDMHASAALPDTNDRLAVETVASDMGLKTVSSNHSNFAGSDRAFSLDEVATASDAGPRNPAAQHSFAATDSVFAPLRARILPIETGARTAASDLRDSLASHSSSAGEVYRTRNAVSLDDRMSEIVDRTNAMSTSNFAASGGHTFAAAMRRSPLSVLADSGVSHEIVDRTNAMSTSNFAAAGEHTFAAVVRRSPLSVLADSSVSHEIGGLNRVLFPIAAGPNAHLTLNIADKASKFNNALATKGFSGRTGRFPFLSADEMPPVNTPEPVAPVQQQTRVNANNYCDRNYVGQPIAFSQTAQLTLDDLLYQIHSRFGINFLMGPEIGGLPINIRSGSIPWNTLLRSQLFVSGVRATCIDDRTIQLVKNEALPRLQDAAEVETRFVKLKFLQRTSTGTVDLANRSQGGQGGQGGGCGGTSQTSGGGGGVFGGGGGQSGSQSGETAGQQSNNKFDKLIVEIEKILGIRSMTESSVGSGGQGGQTGGQQTEEKRTNRYITQIPGRNILVIRATQEEHELIDQIISRADRPPFQVVIKGLVYSANQDRLRDVGVQTTILGSAGPSDNPNGGIFGHTLGAAGTLFDFSTIIGTFDFNVQATALQQNGVISVKSRPFSTVLDGLCTKLTIGTQLPIVIDAGLGGVGSITILDASNNLAVTPYVIDDENGNPVAVTLELLLRANTVDSSITARDIPAVSSREIQTQLLLTEDKTAILGGFTIDQDSRTVSKTPGLGDIPIIGELFKRRVRDTRINRLYFAISVDVIPYPDAIRPVDVPGATTNPPSLTPEMDQRQKKAEPKQVTEPSKTGP
jgi:Flp pilus assembly secretin CpaC